MKLVAQLVSPLLNLQSRKYERFAITGTSSKKKSSTQMDSPKSPRHSETFPRLRNFHSNIKKLSRLFVSSELSFIYEVDLIIDKLTLPFSRTALPKRSSKLSSLVLRLELRSLNSKLCMLRSLTSSFDKLYVSEDRSSWQERCKISSFLVLSEAKVCYKSELSLSPLSATGR